MLPAPAPTLDIDDADPLAPGSMALTMTIKEIRNSDKASYGEASKVKAVTSSVDEAGLISAFNQGCDFLRRKGFPIPISTLLSGHVISVIGAALSCPTFGRGDEGVRTVAHELQDYRQLRRYLSNLPSMKVPINYADGSKPGPTSADSKLELATNLSDYATRYLRRYEITNAGPMTDIQDNACMMEIYHGLGDAARGLHSGYLDMCRQLNVKLNARGFLHYLIWRCNQRTIYDDLPAPRTAAAASHAAAGAQKQSYARRGAGYRGGTAGAASAPAPADSQSGGGGRGGGRAEASASQPSASAAGQSSAPAAAAPAAGNSGSGGHRSGPRGGGGGNAGGGGGGQRNRGNGNGNGGGGGGGGGRRHDSAPAASGSTDGGAARASAPSAAAGSQ